MRRNSFCDDLSVRKPFREVTQLQGFRYKFYGRSVPAFPNSDGLAARDGEFVPRTEVHENRDGLALRMEITGFQREDIDISLDGNKLTVKGEWKLPNEERAGSDLALGMFSRAFVLPAWVDKTTLTVNCVDGVLEIIMAKRAEARLNRIPAGAETAALGNGPPALLQPA